MAAIKFKIITALQYIFLSDGNNSKPRQIFFFKLRVIHHPKSALRVPFWADCIVYNLGFHVWIFRHERGETEHHGDDLKKDQMPCDIPEDSQFWRWFKGILKLSSVFKALRKSQENFTLRSRQ